MADDSIVADDGASKVAGSIEVLRDAESRMWYSAYVVELAGQDRLRVAYEGDVWPQEELPTTRVRKVTRSQVAIDSFNPLAGDEVELRINASEHQPGGWSAARVTNIKHGFYFVIRLTGSHASHDTNQEAIVEKAMLRESAPSKGLDSVHLQVEPYKLPKALVAWAMSSDALGCFSHIEEQAGLLLAQPKDGVLKLVGENKAIQRAKMLVEVHVKHQAQIQNFQGTRDKRLKALEQRRSRIEGTGYKHHIEIRIDPSFVARVIGKNGEAIRSVEDKYQVNVRILDNDEGQDFRIVRIYGNNQESIEKARGEVEYIEESLQVEPQMNSWILGRGGKTIQDIRAASGIVYAKLDRDTQQLMLCGTRNLVEDAIIMFETHIMYFPVFNQMNEEMDEIVSNLRRYGDRQPAWDWSWGYEEEDDGYGNNYGGGHGGGGWNRNSGKSGAGGKGSGGGYSKGKGGKGGDGSHNKQAEGSKDGNRSKTHIDWEEKSSWWEQGWEEEWQPRQHAGKKEAQRSAEAKDEAKGEGRKGGTAKAGRGKGRKDEQAWKNGWDEDESHDESSNGGGGSAGGGKKGKGRGGKTGGDRGKRADSPSDDEKPAKGKGNARSAEKGKGGGKTSSKNSPVSKGKK